MCYNSGKPGHISVNCKEPFQGWHPATHRRGGKGGSGGGGGGKSGGGKGGDGTSCGKTTMAKVVKRAVAKGIKGVERDPGVGVGHVVVHIGKTSALT